MTPAYMPFTYLSDSTARTLAALVGPVVVYQPLKTTIHESARALASQGLIEVRTPIGGDDDRLRAALAEFTEWARMNPGKSTPGADFFSQRQSGIPFFDDTVINRIRSDINRHLKSDPLADHQAQKAEAEFSARLFLALAQMNDLATDRLDQDLNRFNALEKDFLKTLSDADDAGFNRRALGAEIWRDDPGAKLTGQRMRAWATLAAADAVTPELLVTTSRAVIDGLLETQGEALRIEKLADIRLAIPSPSAGTVPVFAKVLADLAGRPSLPSANAVSFEKLAVDAAFEPAATATVFVAANQTPASVIRQIAAAADTLPEKNGQANSICHTLIILVEK